MKHAKIAAFALAAAMTMSMGMPVFAADPAPATTYTLTIDKTTTGHTYDVYQIYTGDLSTDATTKALVLSNVKYGKNYQATGKAVGDEVPDTEITALEAMTGAAAAASFNLTGDAFIKGVTSGNGKTEIANLPAGYYLVKESGTTTPDGEAMTAYILQVVGDTKIEVKSKTTESQKKIKDINDTEGTTETDWQDSADWDIGDLIPFQLQATIAADYASYTNGYTLKFHDTESQGLTFQKDTVKVYVDGTEIKTGFTVVTEGLKDGCTFEVVFDNLKNITSVGANSKVTVEYKSKLNENAKLGSEGNPNTSHITYTNNMYDKQHGDNGKTPDDKVIAFTYKLDVNKFGDDNKTVKLDGAEFALYKETKDKDGNDVAVKVNLTKGTGDAANVYTAKGIDDGTYILVETKAPEGYNLMDGTVTFATTTYEHAKEFTVTATHEVDAADPKLLTLSGSAKEGSVITLEETDKTKHDGLKTDVIDKAGSTLPSTGGMGTTILYVLGGLLVAGAVVVLVLKNKKNA